MPSKLSTPVENTQDWADVIEDIAGPQVRTDISTPCMKLCTMVNKVFRVNLGRAHTFNMLPYARCR